MKFHGRIAPGRVTDLAVPIQMIIHQPVRCAQVTIKIWELDAYLGADGKPRREGTPDDLLATFTGDIEPAPKTGGKRAPEWRTFKVTNAEIAEAPPDALRVLLQFPGSETVYEIPVISEADETEGTNYELGFSIEVAGAEKFRTKSPALLAPATVRPRVREILILGLDDNGKPILKESLEVSTGATTAVAGVAPADFDEDSDDAQVLSKVLERVTKLVVDATGHLVKEAANAARTAVTSRVGKKLRVYLHHGEGEPPTEVSAALAHPVAPDGTVTVYQVDTSHRRTLFTGGAVRVEAQDGRQVAVHGDLLSGRPTINLAALTSGKHEGGGRR